VLPAASAPVSADRDQVSDPAGLIVGARAGTVALDVHLVTGVPVHPHVREAGFAQQLLDFRQRPKAPLVGECLVEPRAVLELEVDVVHYGVADGVEARLLPDVCEPRVDLATLEHGFLCFPTAVRIQEEEAFLSQRLEDGREVLAQLVPCAKDPVAEVHRVDDVELASRRRADVLLQQLDAFGRGAQGGEVVRPAPRQRVAANVHAGRTSVRRAFYPRAAEKGGAAEVLAHFRRLAPVQFAESARHELDLTLWCLDA